MSDQLVSLGFIESSREVIRVLDRLEREGSDLAKCQGRQSFLGFRGVLVHELGLLFDLLTLETYPAVLGAGGIWVRSEGALEGWKRLMRAGRPAADAYWLLEQAVLMAVGLGYSEVRKMHPILLPRSAKSIPAPPLSGPLREEEAHSLVDELARSLYDRVWETEVKDFALLFFSITDAAKHMARGNIAVAAGAMLLDGSLLSLSDSGVNSTYEASVSALNEIFEKANGEISPGQVSIVAGLAAIEKAVTALSGCVHKREEQDSLTPGLWT